MNDVGKLTAIDAKNRADVKAYDANGNDITATVTVDQDKLNELTAKGKGIYAAALTFQAGTGVATSITVEVTDDNPTVIGKTAHTLTFMGRPKTEYNVQERDTSGNLVGNVLRFTTDGNGKGIAYGLKKQPNIRSATAVSVPQSERLLLWTQRTLQGSSKTKAQAIRRATTGQMLLRKRKTPT